MVLFDPFSIDDAVRPVGLTPSFYAWGKSSLTSHLVPLSQTLACSPPSRLSFPSIFFLFARFEMQMLHAPCLGSPTASLRTYIAACLSRYTS